MNFVSREGKREAALSESFEFCEDCLPKVQSLLKQRQTQGRHYLRRIWGIVSALIVFSATITLLLTLLFPVFKVQRGSMAPSLNDGDVAVFVTAGKIRQGDIVAFHHGNNVLIKRVIAVSGDWVEISGDGAVTLNGVPFDDPYSDGYGSGEELSAQVPDKHFFVLGDQRRMSLDSRNEEIGIIPREHIIGKHLLRIWPMKRRS